MVYGFVFAVPFRGKRRGKGWQLAIGGKCLPLGCRHGPWELASFGAKGGHDGGGNGFRRRTTGDNGRLRYARRREREKRVTVKV